MKKRIANWITHIIGIIMMGLGAYMIFIEKPFMYAITMFGLGVVSFVAFNKLGDIFITVLSSILKNQNNGK